MSNKMALSDLHIYSSWPNKSWLTFKNMNNATPPKTSGTAPIGVDSTGEVVVIQNASWTGNTTCCDEIRNELTTLKHNSKGVTDTCVVGEDYKFWCAKSLKVYKIQFSTFKNNGATISHPIVKSAKIYNKEGYLIPTTMYVSPNPIFNSDGSQDYQINHSLRAEFKAPIEIGRVEFIFGDFFGAITSSEILYSTAKDWDYVEYKYSLPDGKTDIPIDAKKVGSNYEWGYRLWATCKNDIVMKQLTPSEWNSFAGQPIGKEENNKAVWIKRIASGNASSTIHLRLRKVGNPTKPLFLRTFSESCVNLSLTDDKKEYGAYQIITPDSLTEDFQTYAIKLAGLTNFKKGDRVTVLLNVSDSYTKPFREYTNQEGWESGWTWGSHWDSWTSSWGWGGRGNEVESEPKDGSEDPDFVPVNPWDIPDVDGEGSPNNQPGSMPWDWVGGYTWGWVTFPTTSEYTQFSYNPWEEDFDMYQLNFAAEDANNYYEVAYDPSVIAPAYGGFIGDKLGGMEFPFGIFCESYAFERVVYIKADLWPRIKTRGWYNFKNGSFINTFAGSFRINAPIPDKNVSNNRLIDYVKIYGKSGTNQLTRPSAGAAYFYPDNMTNKEYIYYRGGFSGLEVREASFKNKKIDGDNYSYLKMDFSGRDLQLRNDVGTDLYMYVEFSIEVKQRQAYDTLYVPQEQLAIGKELTTTVFGRAPNGDYIVSNKEVKYGRVFDGSTEKFFWGDFQVHRYVAPVNWILYFTVDSLNADSIIVNGNYVQTSQLTSTVDLGTPFEMWIRVEKGDNLIKLKSDTIFKLIKFVSME